MSGYANDPVRWILFHQWFPHPSRINCVQPWTSPLIKNVPLLALGWLLFLCSSSSLNCVLWWPQFLPLPLHPEWIVFYSGHSSCPPSRVNCVLWWPQFLPPSRVNCVLWWPQFLPPIQSELCFIVAPVPAPHPELYVFYGCPSFYPSPIQSEMCFMVAPVSTPPHPE